MTVREKTAGIIEGLCKGVYEKEEAIKLALLAAVAGESIFLLGPPGVAKSLIARRLKYAFKDGNSFEYLMNRFSTPDEIFGPVSIKKLKDEDKYERLTDKYMPGAKVVFLDEIWKAGASIQNALLTILNERIYRNGEEEIKVDIKTIISASNELPRENEGLEALWDRFLIRYVISEIKEKGNFLSMITNTDNVYADHIEANFKISESELAEWEMQINQVEVPAEVLNTIQVIKLKIQEHDVKREPRFEIYDRRWKKAVHLLRTSAFLNGRQKVDLMDCFLLVHCLWSNPQHLEFLKGILVETIRNHGYSIALNLSSLKKEIEALEVEIKTETKIPHQETKEGLYLVDKAFYEVLNIGKTFEGKYVKQPEFDRLSISEFTAIGLYDEHFKLVYKINCKKGRQENTLEIFHNAQELIFPLKTTKQDTTIFLYKKPHPLLKDYWDKQVLHLQQYINEAQKKVEEESPSELKLLHTNYFVPASLTEVVEANLKDSQKTLQQLSLQVEKLKHYYEYVGD